MILLFMFLVQPPCELVCVRFNVEGLAARPDGGGAIGGENAPCAVLICVQTRRPMPDNCNAAR